jgi:DNA-binding CsgD family transcriptional regulator
VIGLGRLTEARAGLQRFEAQAAESGRTAAQATIARLFANLEAAQGRDDEAATAFARARSLADEGRDPFDRAKTQAAHGAFLRRLGRRRPAAAELCAARSTFERLGARPYVERCERELAASGLEPRRRRPGPTAELTPQETSVAQLVAQGKSNRTVAEELVVSVNTIEYHLKNIYAKLGIRSRTQLTLRLAAPGDDRG